MARAAGPQPDCLADQCRRKLGSTSLIVLLQFLLLNPGFGAEAGIQAQQELESVTDAIASIQAWLVDANQRHTEEESNLAAAELRLSGLSQAGADTAASVSQSQAELTTLQRRRDRLQADKAEQNAALTLALRAAYMAGEQNVLKLLLNQQDISNSARMLHYSRVFSESQLQKITTFQDTLAAIELVDAELEARLGELNRQQLELQTQMQAMTTARAERAAAIAELNASIANRSSELQQLELNQAELQELIEQINRALQQVQSVADLPPFSERRGELAAPANGQIINRFGARYGGGSLTRQGITIGVDAGTAVHSVHAGRVVFSDWLRGSGLLLIIDHGTGYMSLYGANQTLSKAAGDWVEAGEIVAMSGSSADATEGVYFEIRHHGQAQNPASWFADDN